MTFAEPDAPSRSCPKKQLAAWLAERDQAEWDTETERDFAPGGAGIPLLEQMKADVRAGNFCPLKEGPGARLK
jgi:hypothetical protein